MLHDYGKIVRQPGGGLASHFEELTAMEALTAMKELRQKDRRHDFDSAQLFPFFDRSGRIVHQDRRTMPDRRFIDIYLEVVSGRAVDLGGERSH